MYHLPEAGSHCLFDYPVFDATFLAYRELSQSEADWEADG